MDLRVYSLEIRTCIKSKDKVLSDKHESHYNGYFRGWEWRRKRNIPREDYTQGLTLFLQLGSTTGLLSIVYAYLYVWIFYNILNESMKI